MYLAESAWFSLTAHPCMVPSKLSPRTSIDDLYDGTPVSFFAGDPAFTSIRCQMPRMCKSKRSFLWRTHTLLKSFLEFPGHYHFFKERSVLLQGLNYCISSIPQVAPLNLKTVSLLHMHHRVTIKEDCVQPQPVTAILHRFQHFES